MDCILKIQFSPSMYVPTFFFLDHSDLLIITLMQFLPIQLHWQCSFDNVCVLFKRRKKNSRKVGFSFFVKMRYRNGLYFGGILRNKRHILHPLTRLCCISRCYAKFRSNWFPLVLKNRLFSGTGIPQNLSFNSRNFVVNPSWNLILLGQPLWRAVKYINRSSK